MTIENTTRWYVMTLLNMSRFQEWLKAENARHLSKGEAIIEPFYPHDFLRSSSSSHDVEGASNNHSVSDDFSNFVFLKGTESEIKSLVEDRYNKESRIWLRHYLDTDGTHATISEKMMNDFFEACLKYRGRFEITPSIDGIESMDKVEIKTGPFVGYEASVMKVRHSKGAIHLDLAIQMVSGVMNIHMANVNKDQVAILNRSSVDAIRTDFIEYTQNHVLNILEHRVKSVDDKEVNQRDAAMLTRLFRYRNHHVENEAARNHFLALMLICAHLCRFASEEEELMGRVLDNLATINQKSESKAATDTRTYMWISLYIVTRDPAYRDAIKQYVRDHQPKSPKLRRFVSLIREGKKV